MTHERLSGVVLDSSAVIAALQGEPGSTSRWLRAHPQIVSSVNWSEIVQKAHQRLEDPEEALAGIRAGLAEVVPFTAADAELAAELWSRTRGKGLSLADRACLALGMTRGLPVVTADRLWAEVGLDVEVVVVR